MWSSGKNQAFSFFSWFALFSHFVSRLYHRHLLLLAQAAQRVQLLVKLNSFGFSGASGE